MCCSPLYQKPRALYWVLLVTLVSRREAPQFLGNKRFNRSAVLSSPLPHCQGSLLCRCGELVVFETFFVGLPQHLLQEERQKQTAKAAGPPSATPVSLRPLGLMATAAPAPVEPQEPQTTYAPALQPPVAAALRSLTTGPDFERQPRPSEPLSEQQVSHRETAWTKPRAWPVQQPPGEASTRPPKRGRFPSQEFTKASKFKGHGRARNEGSHGHPRSSMRRGRDRDRKDRKGRNRAKFRFRERDMCWDRDKGRNKSGWRGSQQGRGQQLEGCPQRVKPHPLSKQLFWTAPTTGKLS